MMASQYTNDPSGLVGLLLIAIRPLGALVPDLLTGRIKIAPDAFLFIIRSLGAQMVEATSAKRAEHLFLHWGEHSGQFVKYLETQAAASGSNTIRVGDLANLDCLKIPRPPD